MKALTITQPWASLIALGEKKIETRGWSTNFRGTVAIHAGVRYPREAKYLRYTDPDYVEAFARHPGELLTLIDSSSARGTVIAVAELEDCISTNQLRSRVSVKEFAFGDYSGGRFGFMLGKVRRLLDPIPCKGALSLWEVPPNALFQIEKQLKEGKYVAL